MTRFMRWISAALVTAQAVWFVVEVLSQHRFSRAFFDRWTIAAIGAVAYLVAAAALVLWSRRRRIALAIAPASMLTLAFYLPLAGRWWEARALRGQPDRMDVVARMSPDVRYLRELSAAQEQFRLTHGAYAATVDSLHRWIDHPVAGALRLTAHGDAGWSATLAASGGPCAVWARDTTLRVRDAPEGAPVCVREDSVELHHAIFTVLAPAPAPIRFTPTDVGGVWTQHRADRRHSGIVASNAGAYRWDARVAGELRASAAIAGNQVFIGAHGNGEFTALSLDHGQPGFRVRAPNWIHHEPVVTRDLAIVGFGNNETHLLGKIAIGSEPGGVVAYDRRTGVERWRRYAAGAVMTSPVLFGDMVEVITGAGEGIAWKAADGTEVWRTQLSSFSPMGNPMLADSLLIIGVEDTGVCALDARTGRTVWCTQLSVRGWGAGHASVADGGDVLLAVYDRSARLELSGWLRWAATLFNRRVREAEPVESGELILVGLDRATGQQRWSTPLGVGHLKTYGHVAGTPVVNDGVAYVPSFISGQILAVDVKTGRIVWAANVKTARGTVLVANGLVAAATTDSSFAVLDASTGAIRCQQRLPGLADRAAPTVSGQTGVLTLKNGTILARPLLDWLACKA